MMPHPIPFHKGKIRAQFKAIAKGRDHIQQLEVGTKDKTISWKQ
jgi:hypothetical protein